MLLRPVRGPRRWRRGRRRWPRPPSVGITGEASACPSLRHTGVWERSQGARAIEGGRPTRRRQPLAKTSATRARGSWRPGQPVMRAVSRCFTVFHVVRRGSGGVSPGTLRSCAVSGSADRPSRPKPGAGAGCGVEPCSATSISPRWGRRRHQGTVDQRRVPHELPADAHAFVAHAFVADAFVAHAFVADDETVCRRPQAQLLAGRARSAASGARRGQFVGVAHLGGWPLRRVRRPWRLRRRHGAVNSVRSASSSDTTTGSISSKRTLLVSLGE